MTPHPDHQLTISKWPDQSDIACYGPVLSEPGSILFSIFKPKATDRLVLPFANGYFIKIITRLEVISKNSGVSDEFECISVLQGDVCVYFVYM